MSKLILVTGAGGFIGGHLVKRLLTEGFRVRAVDCKPLKEWWQTHNGVQEVPGCDLSILDNCRQVCHGVDEIYNLSADMGGMGFIEANKALCMLSVLTSTHLLLAAKEQKVQRFFYASSACVYAAGRQMASTPTPLRESDAYPAQPEDGYGWEKLFTERMCRHFLEDFGLETRVARYHNVYGEMGSWTGGREKAPAAICRKIAEAILTGRKEIEIWGDGSQARSFMYVDDCIEGTRRLMDSNVIEPLNVGSSEGVTINQLVDTVEEIAGVKLERKYKLDAPRGVSGRNSDNTLIWQRLGWEPSISLRSGLEKTYQWIYQQVKKRGV